MLQNYTTIPLYITHKNVTFCHEGTGVQKGFLIAACLLACSLFKHPLLSVVSFHIWCGTSSFNHFPSLQKPHICYSYILFTGIFMLFFLPCQAPQIL